MASLYLSPTLATITTLSTTPSFPLHNKAKTQALRRNTAHGCKASLNDEEGRGSPNKFDRRDVLLGLGGLYGVAGSAMAGPVLPPDLSKCSTPDTLPAGVVTECCPPFSPTIVDFVPTRPTTLRVRPAAHSASPEYVAKYERALALMRALPDDDPRSFKQQAMVHCAYCNGAYDQVGFGELDLQVHNNWLFFPFHRWYMFFFERILGSLIGDPDFATPFWNWDHPDGMTMPAMFTRVGSPLYNPNRSQANQPPYIVDLNYDFRNRGSAENNNKSNEDQIRENLVTMYRQMISQARLGSLFFGGEYHAGDPVENSPGTIENMPHTPIHVLCGHERNETLKAGEDMGNFYSAGRDPMFYAHHGNVDRMWNVYKTLPAMRLKRDITDPDWLDTAFLFYDENAQLVRVKVGDCVDSTRLGYIYEDVENLWNAYRPQPNPASLTFFPRARAASGAHVGASDFPVTLKDSRVTVVVQRPNANRSKEEKETTEEVLVVQGIDFDREEPVKFDVFVNDEDEELAPDKAQFAGSFGNVPHKVKNDTLPQKVSLRLGISELLEDIGADNDKNIIVTLVPRNGDLITIEGITIEIQS